MQGNGAFRIDLLDPTTGGKTGDFSILSTTQLTRQRGLDRIGKWAFDMSVADPALADIEGSDFAVYWAHGNETYYLGQCSYLDHSIQAQGDSRTVQVNASGTLRDLTRQTVLARSFDGAADDVNDVLSEIVPLRSGWALGAVDTIATAAPMDFWYETIFDSVAILAKTFGYHFREGSTPKTLDFGAFGADSGVLAVGGDVELPYRIHSNPLVCRVQEISVAYQSSQVVNQLVPFGGAVGVATIDLSEVTSPQAGYAVQSDSLPDGSSYYYIKDPTSQSVYGLTERRFLRKDLRPISNSPTAREYAANILYEAALASLLNMKDPQTVYRLSVAGLMPGLVEVGDKINLLYRGWIDGLAGGQTWLDIDHTTNGGQGKQFYVLEMEETFGDSVSTTLTINENAVAEETVEDLLANTIQAFEQSQIHVQPTASRYTVGPYTKRVDTSVDANFSFNLGAETLDLWYIKIQLTGEPLKSSIQSVAGSSTSSGPSSTSSSGASTKSTTNDGGGTTRTSSEEDDHDHAIVNNTGYVSSGSAGSTNHTHSVNFYTSGGGEHDHSVTIPDHNHGMEHTHNIAHTHTFTPNISTNYGIYEDTQYPSNLIIKVDGSTVASGVTLSAGNDYTYERDITSNVLAAATLQQEHTITVECGSGRGEIVFQAQVLAVIQPIEIS